ncbi:HAD family hydrolase [Fictibacillus sp. WQ 8-8]|uniref:HAD family hydrolase n=1 Tax=Fictibacillus sp. WQ 8-8 TaxID=2938788 RepID=UPI0008E2DAB6|nr:HAD family hydrolase [Fictibacillus sp. WQ 8-8]SFD69004.1 haloacid dehalogenase superfamily, subfamily IA, variant 1 with third motif having Dx(3-4)D or Dx(3-4)E [Bacillus sp. OV194]
MKANGIFFDLDNTLFDYDRAFGLAAMQSFSEMYGERMIVGCTKVNIELDWFKIFKTYCDHFWAGYECGDLSRTAYQNKRFITSLQACGLQAGSHRAAAVFEERLRTYIPSYCKLYAGVSQILQELCDRKMLMGIITNGEKTVQRNKIEALNLTNWIKPQHVFISDEMNVQKPNPAIFEKIQEKTDCSNPLYVGDSWDQDIFPATVSGWKAVWLTTRRSEPKTQGSHLEYRRAASVSELNQLLISYIE